MNRPEYSIEDCKSAKNQKACRTKHQAEYQLHDSLKKSFRISALPKSQALVKSRSELKNLESEQAATVREKQELQKKKKP